VRLQLHALAYNLGNFLRTLATPEPIKDWSLTSLKEKLIKIGAKVVRAAPAVTVDRSFDLQGRHARKRSLEHFRIDSLIKRPQHGHRAERQRETGGFYAA
jgi:Transposase DDE domain group 1